MLNPRFHLTLHPRQQRASLIWCLCLFCWAFLMKHFVGRCVSHFSLRKYENFSAAYWSASYLPCTDFFPLLSLLPAFLSLHFPIAQFRNNLVFAGAAAEILLFALMCRIQHIHVEIYVALHTHTYPRQTSLKFYPPECIYLSSLSRIHSFNVEQFYCFILLFRLAPSFAFSFLER